MSSTAKALAAAFLVLFCGAGTAGETAPAGEDPALEQRVTALASELRCLVCQNQTIADSNAGLAVDLKNQIREKLKQGESESQVLDFMVQRYGDFVLYRPPVKMTTVLLWFGPLLLVLIGLAILYRKVKSQGAAEEPRLTQGDRERAQRLLESDRKGDAA
jgi:cytochrome c-type biogenesis protein CcmH